MRFGPVAAAALLILVGCGGAGRPALSSPRRAGPAAAAAKPVRAAPPTPADAEEALIGMLEKMPAAVLREAAIGPQRTQVVPVPLRIADLPVLANVGPMLDPKLAPATLRDVAAPADLVLRPPTQRSYDWDPSFRPVVVSAVGFTMAEPHIGPWVGGTGGEFRKDGGVEVPCGNKDPFGAVVPARWEGLLVSDKTAQYAMVDGWFDRVSCRASSVRRTSTAVKAIVPDLVYGFRSCGSSCGEEESLTLILPTARAIVTSRSDGTPRASPAGFTRVNLPVRRGGAESMLAYVAGNRRWEKSSASKQPNPRDFVVGVEVTQGIVDREPVAVIFVQPAGPDQVPQAQIDEGLDLSSLDVE